MRKYFRRLTSVAYSWMYVLWVYLSVGCRFWRWRIRLWLQQLHIVESTHTGMKQTLLFIRHGQTTWNAEQKLPGQLPGISLNEKGRKQVADLAGFLPASAIYNARSLNILEYLGDLIDRRRRVECAV